MRRIVSPLLAASSLLLCLAAAAAVRPHYGGRLRVEMRAAPNSLDPTAPERYAPYAVARARVAELIFDRLVRLDAAAQPQPQLALSWQHDAACKRWELWLRPGVKLHDGSPLTPQVVADSLSAANFGWRVRATVDTVIIESDAAQPGLLADLATTRFSIVKRDGETLTGSGPFRLSQWQPGQLAVLTANEDYWGGRPFLDAIEMQMGRALRDQQIDLETGRADVAEVAPDQARRSAQAGLRVAQSSPVDLVALVFVAGHPAADDPRRREALARSLDRAAITTVLLQRQGEPAASLLPQWMSGYAFLFPVTPDLARARQLRGELSASLPLSLAYDSADPLGQAVAERIALNARDAGLTVRPFGELMAARPGNADLRLVHVRLGSADPGASLAEAAAALELQAPARGPGLDDPQRLYDSERALLQDFRVVPLYHLPEAYLLSARVHDWREGAAGGWRLENVWVEGAP
ncbi:MAG TPA: ABC transporter substrate-binding protein [Terriglobales bacterium]|jgi:ABC-type transport system substrate-binding protein|nr:ABC transporter substrate-binding protein [Terriglobales bacterium]